MRQTILIFSTIAGLLLILLNLRRLSIPSSEGDSDGAEEGLPPALNLAGIAMLNPTLILPG